MSKVILEVLSKLRCGNEVKAWVASMMNNGVQMEIVRNVANRIIVLNHVR